jgi:hypothetical protein
MLKGKDALHPMKIAVANKSPDLVRLNNQASKGKRVLTQSL